jgi:hypothetical protein
VQFDVTVAMPSGRFLPSAFGIYFRSDGSARYAPVWTRACRSRSFSSRGSAYSIHVISSSERFTSALAGIPCITRGRCGSLLLHRDGLSPPTFRRSPGAPVHTWPIVSEPEFESGKIRNGEPDSNAEMHSGRVLEAERERR